jgi:hypothetical protein
MLVAVISFTLFANAGEKRSGLEGEMPNSLTNHILAVEMSKGGSLEPIDTKDFHNMIIQYLVRMNTNETFGPLWKGMEFESESFYIGWKQGRDEFRFNFLPVTRRGFRAGGMIVSEYPLAPNNLRDCYFVGLFVSRHF